MIPKTILRLVETTKPLSIKGNMLKFERCFMALRRLYFGHASDQ